MSKIDASGIEHGKRGGKVYQEVRGQQIVKIHASTKSFNQFGLAQKVSNKAQIAVIV